MKERERKIGEKVSEMGGMGGFIRIPDPQGEIKESGIRLFFQFIRGKQIELLRVLSYVGLI